MNRPAFALTELIVAIVLLSLGLLTASGTAMLASRWLREARAEERAVGHALAILDSLSSVAVPANGSEQIDGMTFQWTVAGQQGAHHVRITAAFAGSTAMQPLEFELQIPGRR